MSSGYQIYDKVKAYFCIIQTVGWIDVSSRNDYLRLILQIYDRFIASIQIRNLATLCRKRSQCIDGFTLNRNNCKSTRLAITSQNIVLLFHSHKIKKVDKFILPTFNCFKYSQNYFLVTRTAILLFC